MYGYTLKIVSSAKFSGGTDKKSVDTLAAVRGTAQDYTLTYFESGDLEGCQTVLHVRDGRKISVDRRGDFGMHMVIEKNVAHTSYHTTAAGAFTLRVKCVEIDSEFNRGKLYFKYTLSQGREEIGEFEFYFYFSKAEENL